MLYLDIMLKSSRNFKCSLDSVKIKFYCCFNAIYCQTQKAGMETMSAAAKIYVYSGFVVCI